MKTFSKRVLFCIGFAHLIPHGGLGSFAKSFAEMGERLNWQVDIATDRNVGSEFRSMLESKGVKFYTPLGTLPYNDHKSAFAFSEAPNFEAMANFRSSILEAHRYNLYDLIVCNTLESMPAAYALSLHDYIPVVFYTHNETMIFRDTRTMKTVFSPACNQFYNNLLNVEGVIVGTQTGRNRYELETKTAARHVLTLPMPMPERGLLEPYYGPKRGVINIGRWEPNKNPQAFVDLIAATKLPAKVLTNKTGAEKYRKAFADVGITDYQIGVGLQGQEKVDFIRSSAVHFNPSLRETFSFAMFECIGHMPCFALPEADWASNFVGQAMQPHKDNLVKDVLYWYDVATTPRRGGATGQVVTMPTKLMWVNEKDYEAETSWNSLVTDFAGKQSTSNSATINAHMKLQGAVRIRDFNAHWDRSLSVEDFQSLYGNRHKYRTVYTSTDTYLALDDAFVPTEADKPDTLEELFA